MNFRVPDIRVRGEDNVLLASGYGPRSLLCFPKN